MCYHSLDDISVYSPRALVWLDGDDVMVYETPETNSFNS